MLNYRENFTSDVQNYCVYSPLPTLKTLIEFLDPNMLSVLFIPIECVLSTTLTPRALELPEINI